MRNTLLYFLAALVIFPVMAQQQPEWQSQYAVGLNKLAPHTYVWPYQTVSDIRNGDYESSPYYMSLNGSWKFHWVKNPDNRPKDFYKPEFYTGGMGGYSGSRQLGTSRIWNSYLCKRNL